MPTPMRTVLTLLVLATATVFLTIAGGGLFPVTVAIVVLLIESAAILMLLLPAAGIPAPPDISSQRPFLELVIAGILLAVLLTAIPIPPVLDRVAGSVRHQQNQEVVAAFAKAMQAGIPAPADEPWFCLSRNRAGTLRFFLLAAAAFSAFTLSSTLTPRGRVGWLHLLALTGLVVGLVGFIAQWIIPQGDTIWWFLPVPPAPTKPVGCFLNRNHFGGFIALLCPASLALVDHFFNRRNWIRMVLYMLVTGLMMGIVFLSLSRGAILAMSVGMAVTTILIAFRHKRAWGLTLFMLVAVGGGVVFGRNAEVKARFADLNSPKGSTESRLSEWRESLRVFPSYPLIGAGMNALRMVYPQHRQTSVGARLIHAENEYVQLLVEGGVIGVVLTVALIAAMHRRLREAVSSPPEAAVFAGVGSLTVAGVHCLIDFPAHLPIYALVAGSLAGLLFPPPTPGSGRRKSMALLPALIGLTVTLALLVNHPADLKNMDDPRRLSGTHYRDLFQAMVWAPTSPAWEYLGHAMYREGSNRRDRELSATGESFVSHAAMLDPQNYWLWYHLGEMRLALSDKAGAADAFKRANTLRAWLKPPRLPGETTR